MAITQNPEVKTTLAEELDQYSDSEWLNYFYAEKKQLEMQLRQGVVADSYTKKESKCQALNEVITYIENLHK